MKRRNNTQAIFHKFTISPAERIEIMWKEIIKGKDTWDFYDIKYGEVIITDCRIVEGKNGDFLAMPSKEKNGQYYPIVFLSHSLSAKLLEYIEQADEQDDWEEVETNEFLTFDTDNEKNRKNKNKNKKNENSEND